MNERGIPRKVEVFVINNIYAVEQLEVLLLLRKDPEKKWSAEAVNTVMRTNTSSIAERLEALNTLKLVQKKQEGAQSLYQYAPTSDTKEVVDELAKFYGTHRHVVIELIYSRPAEKIRIFADAFRIRKDD